MKFPKITKMGAALAASALVLTGCGGADNGDSGDTAGGDQNWAECTPGSEAKDISGEEADDNKEITIGAFNGWDESFAVSNLLKNKLEDDGYTVEIKAFDAGPGYTAVANGDVDFLVDGWLPLTHADYIEKFGDKLEAQGCWYNNAKLTIAVNEDSKAKTIEDLKSMSGDYGNTIYGIEPGAGLSKAAKQAVEDYELSDMDLKLSSTPAMLAQLKKSTEADKDVAVTLWRPHWAYDAFPVRDLEDPKGVMGKAEVIYSFSSEGFGEQNPKVAQLLKNLVLDDEHLSSLENVMFSEENYGGEEQDKAAREWMDDNKDWVEQWEKGELKGEPNPDA